MIAPAAASNDVFPFVRFSLRGQIRKALITSRAVEFDMLCDPPLPSTLLRLNFDATPRNPQSKPENGALTVQRLS